MPLCRVFANWVTYAQTCSDNDQLLDNTTNEDYKITTNKDSLLEDEM